MKIAPTIAPRQRAAPIRSAEHLAYVRSLPCCIAGRIGTGLRGTESWAHKCIGPVAPHHVKTRGAGGGDEQVVPLCTDAHTAVHGMGRVLFGRMFGVRLGEIAKALWKKSPANKAAHGK